jgi:hypothetical protein
MAAAPNANPRAAPSGRLRSSGFCNDRPDLSYVGAARLRRQRRNLHCANISRLFFSQR